MDISEKLRKLLSLADRAGTPEEAANAFARAQALATKHRIELASLDLEADPMTQESIPTGKRLAGWRKAVVSSVCAAQGVFVIQIMDSENSLRLAGRAGNVQTAVYLYHAVSAEIERLARANAHGLGRGYVNAYKLGAASEVGKRLREQAKEEIENSRASVTGAAMVRVDNAQKDAERHYRATSKGRIRKANASTYTDASGMRAGRAAGQKINIGGNSALGTAPKALR